MGTQHVIGFAWFNKNDWEEWKKISADKLEDRYEDWLKEALSAKSMMEAKGFTIKQVTITPANFKSWCEKKNKKLDSDSRSQYVTELLYTAHS